MKLTDLEPQFIRYEQRMESDPNYAPAGGKMGDPCLRTYHVPVPTIAEAQGVEFLCPKCFEKNKGPVGTHVVLCWSRTRGAPEDAAPGPGRWKLEGTGFHDLTLNGDSKEKGGGARSVKLLGGCEAHFHVTNGEIT